MGAGGVEGTHEKPAVLGLRPGKNLAGLYEERIRADKGIEFQALDRQRRLIRRPMRKLPVPDDETAFQQGDIENIFLFPGLGVDPTGGFLRHQIRPFHDPPQAFGQDTGFPDLLVSFFKQAAQLCDFVSKSGLRPVGFFVFHQFGGDSDQSVEHVFHGVSDADFLQFPLDRFQCPGRPGQALAVLAGRPFCHGLIDCRDQSGGIFTKIIDHRGLFLDERILVGQILLEAANQNEGQRRQCQQHGKLQRHAGLGRKQAACPAGPVSGLRWLVVFGHSLPVGFSSSRGLASFGAGHIRP